MRGEAIALGLLFAACAAPSESRPPDGDEAGGDSRRGDAAVPGDLAAATGDAAMLLPIPGGAAPCADPQYWPNRIHSQANPVWVHFRGEGQRAMAVEVLGYLDASWAVQVDQLGFTPPVPDGGACGPDGDFDVFLWGGLIESYVESIDDHAPTAWNDWVTYMVVDPWGPYGGSILDATVAHELNHALQSADDWWETPFIFEATATFMEDVVYDGDDSWKDLLVDYQSRPDWSVDYSDDWVTWYMYAGALYLHFLSETYFAGDASFTAQMWELSRSPPGAENDQTLNEPDFVDALEQLLQAAAGDSFDQSVERFARWRWYMGSRDDGAHFSEAADVPANAQVSLAATVTAGAGTVSVAPSPMMYGSGYIRVSGAPGGTISVDLSAPVDPAVRWVVQAVPGSTAGSDGAVVDLSAGPATVSLGNGGSRTLIVTALPTAAADPDQRDGARYPVSLEIN